MENPSGTATQDTPTPVQYYTPYPMSNTSSPVTPHTPHRYEPSSPSPDGDPYAVQISPQEPKPIAPIRKTHSESLDKISWPASSTLATTWP